MSAQATKAAVKSALTTAVHDEPALHSVSAPVDQQEIAKLAYQLWQERGCPEGSAESDWFEAERHLEGESQI